MRVATVAALVLAAASVPAAGAPRPAPAAVVADISPGVNPYHHDFRRPTWTSPPWTRIPGFPKDAARLDLTLGSDYAASRARDDAVWRRYRTGRLHWVPRTNLILYTGRSVEGYSDLPPDGNAGTWHGTGSAAAASRHCPACYVLVVVDAPNLDGRVLRTIADSWPWVDAVTTTNWTGNHTYATADPTYPAATRHFTGTGRPFFAASGNTPVTGVTPAPYPAVILPPWVTTVGGAHSRCRASEALAGRPANFVGDYTESFPATESTSARLRMSGTSFAAPQVAGAFGRVLSEIRRTYGSGRAPRALWAGRAGPGALRDGRLTADEVTDALSATARYLSPAEFAAAACPPEPFIGSTPVPVSATPWAEMGWGYVAAAEAVAAAAVLSGSKPRPAKPAGAAEYMAAFAQVRSAAYP